MNTIAKQFLSAWDSALASKRSWHFLNAKKARVAIEEQGRALAKLGLPQEEFKSLHILAANREFHRRQALLAGAAQDKPISGPAAAVEAPSSTPPPLAVAAPAAPSSPIMNQPTKPAMPEQVTMKIATPTRTPAPRPAASVNIEARRARAFACWNHFAGDGAAERLTQRPILGVTIGPEDGLLEHDLERADYNSESAARVNRAYAKKLQAQRDANTSPAAMLEDVQTILSAALAKGLRIPGESVTGLPMPSHVQPLPPAHRERAQQMLNEFCAVLDGSEEIATSGTPAARAAMHFISEQTGRPYTIGMTIKTRAQIDAERFPHSNIPRL